MYLKIIQTLFSKARPQGSLVRLAADVITIWQKSQRQCSETGFHKLYGGAGGRLCLVQENLHLHRQPFVEISTEKRHPKEEFGYLVCFL